MTNYSRDKIYGFPNSNACQITEPRNKNKTDQKTKPRFWFVDSVLAYIAVGPTVLGDAIRCTEVATVVSNVLILQVKMHNFHF